MNFIIEIELNKIANGKYFIAKKKEKKNLLEGIELLGLIWFENIHNAVKSDDEVYLRFGSFEIWRQLKFFEFFFVNFENFADIIDS